MKIVGVAACTAGIAHTYMAREKLIKGARARGHECRCETQGTIGTEYKLTEQEIADADVVILAVDVKPVIRVGTAAVIKNAIGFIEKVEKALENKG